MSSITAHSVAGGTPRSSFEAIFDGSSLQTTKRRTSKTLKRVASLYSSPKQRESDDGPDEDMWDNNDQDFRYQIMTEARFNSRSRIRPKIDEVWMNGATSMEEVASPNEILSPYSHANSYGASTSTPALLTPFQDSPFSWQQTHSSSSNPRPSSTTNASLITSKSYSTLSSEASTAPTFSSPASSKIDLKARQRYSGGNGRFASLLHTPNCGEGSRTSISEENSPTTASFEQSILNAQSTKNQPSALASSISGHFHYGGWTQEQIDSPGAEADRRFGSFGPYPERNSIKHDSLSPSKSIASATVGDVLNARSYNQDQLGSPPTLQAERLTEISLSNKHRGKALSALLGEPEEVILASRRIEEEKMFSSNPLSKSKATDYRDPEHGIISGLKKRLLSTKMVGNSPNKHRPLLGSIDRSKGDTLVASNSFPLHSSLSDKDALAEAKNVDYYRRPSLPHISTMPVMPAKRRLSMQHSSGLHIPFDLKVQNDVQETLIDSSSEKSTPEPISQQRKSSMESVISRIPRPSENRKTRTESRLELSPSKRESVVEQISFDQARKRSSMTSLGITPDMVSEIIPNSPSSYHNMIAEDTCEELKGETDSFDQEKARRFSLSSQVSSQVPLRPAREDETDSVQRRTSIDSIDQSSRSSLEHSFNVAHNKRWSTVGPAFLTYIDPQKTNVIESNAQNDLRPASPFDSIFKGGRRGSEASASSLRNIVSKSKMIEPKARESISCARDDLHKIGPNANPSSSWTLQSRPDEFGLDNAKTDLLHSPEEIFPLKSGKSWSRRRSFVEPKANRLSNLIKTSIGKKASGFLQSTSPNSKSQKPKSQTSNRDGELPDLSLNGWVEDSMSADPSSVDSTGTWIGGSSPATASFSDSSANRSSAGASSLNKLESEQSKAGHQSPIEIPGQPLTGNTDMRSSRSTYELGNERQRTWHNGSSSNLSATLSSSNILKRPTFGLDLQPDAAPAFDSIPLPETPERSRSRAGSISSSIHGSMSNEHLLLPPPLSLATRSDGDISTEEGKRNDLDTYKMNTWNDRTFSLSIPSDLPADVEDVENLIDEEDGAEDFEDSQDQTLTGDETFTLNDLGDKRSNVIHSPSADEVELLEDDEDEYCKPFNSTDQIDGGKAGGQILFSIHHLNVNENEVDTRKELPSMHSYRFPPGRPSFQDDRSTTSLLLPNCEKANFGQNDIVHSSGERIGQSIYPTVQTSTDSQHSSPIFTPILASHLRRPSSSASYV